MYNFIMYDDYKIGRLDPILKGIHRENSRVYRFFTLISRFSIPGGYTSAYFCIINF